VLHIEDCRSWIETGERLRRTLDGLGLSHVPVEVTLIATEQDAATRPYAGSPTILVDGEDLFPSAGRTRDLVCRIYVTPDGLRALPTSGQLRSALAARIADGNSADAGEKTG